ncbi:hypothetical protein CANCADRAFT_86664 [Tortispora caseinolytica NRRL Y-17796]|uniref:Zn(2)-C6 fungal-type domain-containing protein n=1 Tax=Tortispora caseinolytica NRRL Y-17796 TaxID=767744 RepID=A0A1E4TKY7_9ASCO|nr:hypothetical protein CANCADRAFT_86664 [Tortispora caseinolytica NRRL Y-17796]
MVSLPKAGDETTDSRSRARSRNGCWTCRLRKKKCDEERPVCKRCSDLDIACYGFSDSAPWGNDPRKKSQALDEIKLMIKRSHNKKKKKSDIKKKHQSSASSVYTQSAIPPIASSHGPRSLGLPNSTTIPGLSRVFSDSGTSSGPNTLPSVPESHITSTTTNNNNTSSSHIASLSPDFISPTEVPLSPRPLSNTKPPATKETLPFFEGSAVVLEHATISPAEHTRTIRFIRDRESALLMHFLDTLFQLQFTLYTPMIRDGSRGWLLMMLLKSKPLYSASLAAAALHQQYVLRSASIDISPHVTQELEKYYTYSLQALQRCINITISQQSQSFFNTVETLACICQLVSLEVINTTRSSNWQIHVRAGLDLCRAIRWKFWYGRFSRPDEFSIPDNLKEYSERSTVLPSTDEGTPEITQADEPSPVLEFLAFASPFTQSAEISAANFYSCILIWFDICSATVIATMPAGFKSYQYLLLEDDSIEDPLSPTATKASASLGNIMGCYNHVLLCIAEIAIIHYRLSNPYLELSPLTGSDTVSPGASGDDMFSEYRIHDRPDPLYAPIKEVISSVKARLNAFIKTHQGNRLDAKAAASRMPPPQVRILNERHRMAQRAVTSYTFACAALVYLYTVTNTGDISSAADQTVLALQDLDDQDLLLGLTWPICVAGTMMDTNSTLRSTFLNLIEPLSVPNFGNMGSTIHIVKAAWTRRDQGYPCTWQSVMDELNMRILLV